MYASYSGDSEATRLQRFLNVQFGAKYAQHDDLEHCRQHGVVQRVVDRAAKQLAVGFAKTVRSFMLQFGG